MSSVNLNRQKKLNAQMNEVIDEFDRFEYFFASNWKKIVWAAVAVVVVVSAVVCVKYFVEKSRLEAAAAYDKAADIAALEKAVADNGDAPATVYLKLASMYLDKKDYANARKNLALAAADEDMQEMQYRARLNIGYVDELEGKYNEGAALFADFAKNTRTPGSAAYVAEAYASAGRLYLLAGKKSDARKILETGRNFIQSASGDERPAMQSFGSMINSMLATFYAAPAKKAAAVKKAAKKPAVKKAAK